MGEIKLEQPFMITIEQAIQLSGGAVSRRTIERAVEAKRLRAYKPGKRVMFLPDDIKTWLRRSLK